MFIAEAPRPCPKPRKGDRSLLGGTTTECLAEHHLPLLRGLGHIRGAICYKRAAPTELPQAGRRGPVARLSLTKWQCPVGRGEIGRPIRARLLVSLTVPAPRPLLPPRLLCV